MQENTFFYWHGKTSKNTTLKEELLSYDKVREVKIATAYFSNDGIGIIEKIKEKYGLDSKHVEVYLSPEFSIQQPGNLLEQLRKLCRVYIVYDMRFHPKVYLLKGSKMNKLLFGSSNLTRGGFEENLEFDMIAELNDEQQEKVDMFFDYCSQRAIIVDDEIIEEYRANEKQLKELVEQEKKIKKMIYSYANKNDAFEEDTYDLSNRYFKYKDYETLFIRNQELKDLTIMQRRKDLQDKILAIHEYVNETLKKKGLYCHWKSINITSLIKPCIFNKGRVTWIGVRYGKSQEEVEKWNFGTEYSDEDLGFQKHSCLQFCILKDSFEVNLFHAVKNDAFDREYLHENIDRLSAEIIRAIDNLKGKGYKWQIYNSEEGRTDEFDFDMQESSEFITFYKNKDKRGRESYLMLNFKPDDEVLKDVSTIGNMIIDKFTELLPLYKLLKLKKVD